jgi:hypothetical protein
MEDGICGTGEMVGWMGGSVSYSMYMGEAGIRERLRGFTCTLLCKGSLSDRVDDFLIYFSSIYFHLLGMYGLVVGLWREGKETVFGKSL